MFDDTVVFIRKHWLVPVISLNVNVKNNHVIIVLIDENRCEIQFWKWEQVIDFESLKKKCILLSIVKILQGDRFWTALQVSNIVKKG